MTLSQLDEGLDRDLEDGLGHDPGPDPFLFAWSITAPARRRVKGGLTQ